MGCGRRSIRESMAEWNSFPQYGKLFRDFSTQWKKFFHTVEKVCGATKRAGGLVDFVAFFAGVEEVEGVGGAGGGGGGVEEGEFGLAAEGFGGGVHGVELGAHAGGIDEFHEFFEEEGGAVE